MITSGILTERIAVYKHVNEQNQLGEMVYEWILFRSYWSNIRQVSTRKLLEASREIDDIVITVMLRYTDMVNVGDRLKWNDRSYDISNVQYNKKEGYIILSCEVCVE